MDDSYDVKFVDKNPGFRGYTKSNCLLQQKQEMLATIFNCSMVYSKSVPGARYCTPMELMAIWNPSDVMIQR
jgi:hypothetical protein